MAGAMCADLLDRSAIVYAAVEIYDVVIADVAPAVAARFRCGMPLSYMLHGEGLPLGCRRAMDDDFVYASHFMKGYGVTSFSSVRVSLSIWRLPYW